MIHRPRRRCRDLPHCRTRSLQALHRAKRQVSVVLLFEESVLTGTTHLVELDAHTEVFDGVFEAFILKSSVSLAFLLLRQLLFSLEIV